MSKMISVEEAVQLENPIFIDLRSPSEYEAGRLPDAINIPLFTDEERAKVGTLYKQVGSEQAKDLGLSIISPKLHAMVNEIRNYALTKHPVVLYCWRGGMRSGSVATVLELMGIQTMRLNGGYKAYRRYILDQLENFEIKPQVIVVCGSTGVGKTLLLQKLAERGQAVIDLEKLANHRGSAFGHVGLGKPETAQNFDAQLFKELIRVNEYPAVLVECESKRIGNVYLPSILYQSMQRGKKILVQANLEIRVERLLEDYLHAGRDNTPAVIDSIRTLSKRLGTKRAEQLIAAYESGESKEVVKTLLVDYYDPLYGYETADLANYDLCVNADDLDQAAAEIGKYIDSLGR